MKATKEQLRNNIGKEVFIVPRGNLVNRYNKEVKILNSIIKSVTHINLILETPVGSHLTADKFKIDGSYDSRNCGGELFLSKEVAENYLWRENFLKDFKYNIDMNKLTYEDCREIDNILRKYE